MAQNVTGQELDYNTFKQEYDSSEQLKPLIDKFDDKGITIKTAEKADEIAPVRSS